MTTIRPKCFYTTKELKYATEEGNYNTLMRESPKGKGSRTDEEGEEGTNLPISEEIKSLAVLWKDMKRKTPKGRLYEMRDRRDQYGKLLRVCNADESWKCVHPNEEETNRLYIFMKVRTARCPIKERNSNQYNCQPAGLYNGTLNAICVQDPKTGKVTFNTPAGAFGTCHGEQLSFCICQC